MSQVFCFSVFPFLLFFPFPFDFLIAFLVVCGLGPLQFVDNKRLTFFSVFFYFFSLHAMRHSRSDWETAAVGGGRQAGRQGGGIERSRRRRGHCKAAFLLFMCLINFRLFCCENEVWKCNRRRSGWKTC